MMQTVRKAITTSNNMADAAADTVDHAMSSAHKAIDQVSDAARPVVDRIATGAHQAVDKLAGAATKAADTFDNKGDQLKEMLARLSESCSAHVRDKPLRSLGYAVAAGFLLSWLIKQR